MSRQAHLADGTILEFPDDTPDDVIDRTVKQHMQAAADYEGKPMPGGGLEIAPRKPEKKPTLLHQLGEAALNDMAGLAQGAASIPDAATEAMAGGMRYLTRGGEAVGEGLFNALGLHGAADRVERNAKVFDQGLSRPATIGGMIEKAVPTKPGMGGSRLAAQFIGGAMVPVGPKVTLPAKLPVATAASEAQQVVNAGNREGVRVMTSDVKPPTTFLGKTARATGERIPFAGTGTTRAAQQTERVGAIKNLVREYGGSDTNELFDSAPTAINDVAENLAKTRGKEISRLTFAKDTIIDGTPGQVPVPKTMQAIDEQIARLKDTNPEKLAPAIKELEVWKRTLQGKSLRGVEENRKLLGDAFNAPELASVRSLGEKAINAIYGPLREDMGDFIHSTRGELDFTRWKAANDKLSAMMGQLDAASFRNVLRNNEVTPEAIGNLLFSKKGSDVARLYANLDPVGKSRAQAAVLQRAFDKAISPDGGLSAERFTGNLKQLGESVGIVFQGDDLTRIRGLTKLVDATRRASEAALQPPTGVQNAPFALGYSLGTMFGKAAIPVAAVGGFMARAYESAAVRDILLKLGKAKPGTGAEANLMKRATIALTEMADKHLAPALNDNAMPLSAVGKGAPPQDQYNQPAP